MSPTMTADKMTIKLDTPYTFLLDGSKFEQVNEVKISHPDPSIQWKTEIINPRTSDQLEVQVTASRVLHSLVPQVSQLTILDPGTNGSQESSTFGARSEQPSSAASVTMTPTSADSGNPSLGISMVPEHPHCDPPEICLLGGFSITITIFVEIAL